MHHRWIVPALLTAALLATGCAAVIAGAGAGAGVYTYLKGELRRAYPADVERTLGASLQTLQALRIRVEEKETDGITTTVHAKRVDGTPVTLKVTRLAPQVAEVGVRSGYVGFWDRRVSELIHAEIAQRL